MCPGLSPSARAALRCRLVGAVTNPILRLLRCILQPYAVSMPCMLVWVSVLGTGGLNSLVSIVLCFRGVEIPYDWNGSLALGQGAVIFGRDLGSSNEAYMNSNKLLDPESKWSDVSQSEIWWRTYVSKINDKYFSSRFLESSFMWWIPIMSTYLENVSEQRNPHASYNADVVTCWGESGFRARCSELQTQCQKYLRKFWIHHCQNRLVFSNVCICGLS